MKKIILLFLITVLTVTALATPAFASSKNQINPPTEGVQSLDPMYGSSNDSINLGEVTTAGGLLMNWGSSISNAGNGTVDIYGYTQTYFSVNTVKVTVYLQKWTGSQWVDITGITNSGSNTSYVSASQNIAVTSGYYYRVRAVHTAIGSTSETANSTSSYIYI